MSTALQTPFFPELVGRIASGNDYPFLESDNELAIKYWCNSAYEEAEADQKTSEELKMVDKYVEYLQGVQWPTARPSYRAKPVDNRMFGLFLELLGLLTDIRPVAEIHSTSREKQYIDQEENINKRMRAWWANNNIEQTFGMGVIYGILTTSFLKLEWDPWAKPMGRGEICLRPLGPTTVLPLKCGHDLQSSQALIYADWKPVGWVKTKYPKRAYLVRPDISFSQYQVDSGPPGNVTPQLFNLLTPAMQRKLSPDRARVGISAYPMCKYREFWIKDFTVNTSNQEVVVGDKNNRWGISYSVKPNEMLYPRGRLIVMAGKEIVEDTPNPYWHGMFPFSLMRLNAVPWQLYGMSDLRSWADLQDIVNTIVAGVIDMIKKAVNPPFFAPKTAFSEQVWNSIDFSMPGARAAYNAVSPHEPKVMNVAPLPGFVLPMLQHVTREMDQRSGIAAIGEAVRKKQVPGGDTLDQIRQSQQGPIRYKGRNIETCISELGQQMVPNIFQFYRDDQRIRMPGAPGAPPDFLEWPGSSMIPSNIQPFEYIRNFEFTIQEGSLLGVQRMEQAMNLIRLRQSREISRKTFFDRLNKLGFIYLDADQEEQALIKEAQEGLMAPPKGKNAGRSAKAAGAAMV
jgi:hypothetical protein